MSRTAKETPPVGHSMPVDAIPREPNGSISPGGASSLAKKARYNKFDKVQLKQAAQELSCRMTTWLLEGNRLEDMMASSKLKDLMIAYGITTEKLLLLEGQPTSIVGSQQQTKLDDLLPKLQEEIKRRKLGVKLVERSIELKDPATA